MADLEGVIRENRNLMLAATAEALERGRERYNTAFLAARRGGAAIDPQAFLQHIQTVVVPIVDAVASRMAERAAGVLDGLYSVSTQLFNASMLGSGAKTQAVNRVWAELLPSLTHLLVRDPQRLAATLSNAAHNIEATPEPKVDLWIRDLLRLAPQCTDVSDLLEAGKIAAWRAGMAHYRKGALAAAKLLPPALTEAALEAAVQMADRWQFDPWADPDGKANLTIVARAGAFRGFGGRFIRPPRVWSSTGQLFASDGEGTWQLIADRFGCVFMRHDVRPLTESSKATVRSDGCVVFPDQRAMFAELASATSFAFDGVTLAVTIPTSHAVYLVAKGAADAR
jgi:hypothetical protein